MHIPNQPLQPPTRLTIHEKTLPDRCSYSLHIIEEDETAEPFSMIAEDVTENADSAISFAKLLVEEKISPHHFADIVEDSLPLK